MRRHVLERAGTEWWKGVRRRSARTSGTSPRSGRRDGCGQPLELTQPVAGRLERARLRLAGTPTSRGPRMASGSQPASAMAVSSGNTRPRGPRPASARHPACRRISTGPDLPRARLRLLRDVGGRYQWHTSSWTQALNIFRRATPHLPRHDRREPHPRVRRCRSGDRPRQADLAECRSMSSAVIGARPTAAPGWSCDFTLGSWVWR